MKVHHLGAALVEKRLLKNLLKAVSLCLLPTKYRKTHVNPIRLGDLVRLYVLVAIIVLM